MSSRDPDAAANLQRTIRLSAEGIAKVLGDLEARVMRAVWDLDRPAPARVVHDRVIVEHPVALHTVITVLNKLVVKGLLRRDKKDQILHYQPALSEDAFRAQVSRRVVEGILSLAPDAISASFVDVLGDRDPGELKKLMRLIQERLREEEQEKEDEP